MGDKKEKRENEVSFELWCGKTQREEEEKKKRKRRKIEEKKGEGERKMRG